VQPQDGNYLANFRLPPGTARGWNDVRLRLKKNRFGRTSRIAVDLPTLLDRIKVHGVCGGSTWRPGEVGDSLSCWVEGLPENADIANVRLWIGDCRLRVLWVGEAEAGVRQINASVPQGCGPGSFVVECGGVRSDGLEVKIL
jgi:hypothetical protein